MRLTIAHIAPLVALIAGILILLMPRLYILAIYLMGLVGLNGIYHFMRESRCIYSKHCELAHISGLSPEDYRLNRLAEGPWGTGK